LIYAFVNRETETATKGRIHRLAPEAAVIRTSAAISAFAALADRLDALAAERARPWWRRLTG
jgi:hypothetical protein